MPSLLSTCTNSSRVLLLGASRHGPQIAKGHHVAYPLPTREQHDEPVDPAAPAARGREAPFEGPDVIFVHGHGFLVDDDDAVLLLPPFILPGQALLVGELSALLEGRVFLLVAVDHLLALDKEFCACRDALGVGDRRMDVRLGERRQAFRDVRDPYGPVEGLGLDVNRCQFVDESRDGRVRRSRQGPGLEYFDQSLLRTRRREVR